ncbi:MAG TPA: glycosyl hydrolase family 65 protein [Thermoleophilia bacterium]|nr:glycosyl hydrolase family 65 protein [Thermoleophilia bacterium]
MSAWALTYEGFDPADEGLREALCTLGNGCFATRGAAPEATADDVHYPGTYVAGCFNRLTTEIAGRDVENEDMVNVPDWLSLTFRIGDGPWFDLRDVTVLAHKLELDMKHGVLTRNTRFRDAAGRTTSVAQRRLVHMELEHVAALETTLTAEDWSGSVEILSALDGTVANTGVPRYRELNHVHLVPVDGVVEADGTMTLVVATSQSHVRLAEAARLAVDGAALDAGSIRERIIGPGYVGVRFGVALEPGRPVTVEKVVALYTSRDAAISAPETSARATIASTPPFAGLLASQEQSWARLWRRFGVALPRDPETSLLLRLHAFHTFQVASPNAADLDVSVPARGLHGEAYRGHIFWDELYILPVVTRSLPEVSRALLLYRYRRLPQARAAARAAGLPGAMFPWQSGSDGREETQTMHLNPRSGRWLEDHSHLQRHVAVAIAYNVWKYYDWTLDEEFLSACGAELFLELTRFMAGLATYNETSGRYDIRGVMGPDEYHDSYPGAERPGIDNNTYTNAMTAWMATKAAEILGLLPEQRRTELLEQLGIDDGERVLWDELSRRLVVVFHDDGVLSQFEGYADLEEFDWDGYRSRYGDIHRLDRILEAEGDTANRYKLSKQADVVMLFYLLSVDELMVVFRRLGYPFDAETVKSTVEYYERRSSHGSTLSRAVYAWVMARIDPAAAWVHYAAALGSDLHDIQGGTTREGVHLGVMASTLDLLERGYMGLETSAGALCFDPRLPDEIDELSYSLSFRGHQIDVLCSHDRLRLSLAASSAPAVAARLCGVVHEMTAGQTVEVSLGAPGQ